MAKLPIRLKRNTDDPLKAQVVQQISDFIRSGKLKPGAALPSTRSLGEQRGISPETVRRAYVQLREAKLIERDKKAGYRVRGSNARRIPAVTTPSVTKARPVSKATRSRAAKRAPAAQRT
ncbi:MAG: GntR family transcriptional regulator [Pseudomonadota bacterium]|nr:GntR family transcriptional regulator [Pseudomonadota bacterium]